MGKAIIAVFILLLIDFGVAYFLGRRSRSRKDNAAGAVPPPASVIDEIEKEIEQRVKGKVSRETVRDIIARVRERNGI